jgi:Mg2+ and Co2+ transporter CorA
MITTLVYRDSRFAAHNPPADTLATLRAEPNVMLWVDLAAPTEAEIKLVLEIVFAFHPLAIEDCVADSPLPKLEEYDDYLYLVMHAVDYSRADKFTTTELDLFLGKNFLVTFHRQPLKPVQTALDRYLKTPGTAVRGPDRFAHVILDLMVEAYKPALDELRTELEQIEGGVLHQIEAGDLFPRVAALRKSFPPCGRSCARSARSPPCSPKGSPVSSVRSSCPTCVTSARISAASSRRPAPGLSSSFSPSASTSTSPAMRPAWASAFSPASPR